eukprot:XP_001707243.1 Hypothetical protein GL50803_36751 [Giardia lamblia ATCC 50803]
MRFPDVVVPLYFGDVEDADGLPSALCVSIDYHLRNIRTLSDREKVVLDKGRSCQHGHFNYL